MNNVCVNICRSKLAMSSTIKAHDLINLMNFSQLKLENIIIQELDELLGKYGSEKITLVIFTGNLETLETKVLPKIPHAFVIWNKIDENEVLREHKEYIKAFNNETEGYNFLKACFEQKAGGKEFDNRVFGKESKKADTKKENDTSSPAIKDQNKVSEDTSDLPPDNKSSQITVNQPVEEDETKLYHRARSLQKRILAQKNQEHQMIGVWAPLNKAGVTNFVINFAIFLAKNNLNVSVLEGLSVQAKLKEWLLRYSDMPKNWISYASAIYEDNPEDKEFNWEYKNVKFYPLDKQDFERKWNQTALEIYMETQKVVDVTLVDFPTGKMTSTIEMSLPHLKELWIMGDSTVPEIFTWKTYIQNKKKELEIPFYFLFNSSYHKEHGKIIAKELDLPLLAHLPPLHKEIMLNYFEKQPIFDKKEVKEKLQPSFQKLFEHIFGEQSQKIPVQMHDKRNILRKNCLNPWKWLLKE